MDPRMGCEGLTFVLRDRATCVLCLCMEGCRRYSESMPRRLRVPRVPQRAGAHGQLGLWWTPAGVAVSERHETMGPAA